MISLFDRQRFNKLAIALAVVIGIGLFGNMFTRRGHPDLATLLAVIALIATIVLVLSAAAFLYFDRRQRSKQ